VNILANTANNGPLAEPGSLSAAHFQDCIESVFQVINPGAETNETHAFPLETDDCTGDSQTVDLKLIDVTTLPGSSPEQDREPFSLLFEADGPVMHANLAISHSSLGNGTIFLTPVVSPQTQASQEEPKHYFEAIFN